MLGQKNHRTLRAAKHERFVVSDLPCANGFGYSTAVMTRRMITVAAGLLAVLLIAACSAPSNRRTGDVDEIRLVGELRVAVRPGFFDGSQTRQLALQEAELLRQFAVRLGVEIRWVEARRNDLVLELVREGSADLAAGRFAVASLHEKELRASAALEWVDDLLVASPDVENDQFTPDGTTVHLRRSALTPSLRTYLTEAGLEIEEVPEEVSIEETLRRVRSGRYRRTIADSGIVHAVRGKGRLRIVDRVPVQRPIAWAVRESNPHLRRAIDHFLFAERVLSRGGRVRDCRDLRQVRQAGVLRLVTRNSASTCTVERGGLAGFEYELARDFARQLRVRLELSIPPQGVDPLRWLEEGYGDIAALHEPIALEDENSFLVSLPYRSVDLVAVVSSRSEPPNFVEDLAGVRAAASRPVASIARQIPLPAPIRARPPAVGADSFNSMLWVARGRGPSAIVDRDSARVAAAGRADLKIGPVVVPKVGLVWVLNTPSRRLHREVNSYLNEARKSAS